LTHVTPSPRLLAAGDNGVIDMAFLSIIRRWALREHLSIREIVRRTKLSRIEAIAPLVRAMAEGFGSI